MTRNAALRILTFVGVLLTTLPTVADPFNDFDAYVVAGKEKHNVPGVSIAIIRQNKISHLFSHGVRDSRTTDPIQVGTIFQVGSVSKPVAAWGVMRLVQEGRLDLDTPVSQYLTRWNLPEAEFDASGVTVRRLLSHTAGLSLGGYSGFDPAEERPSVEASLSGATNGSGGVFLQSEPGSEFSYSGGGYTLLQLLVEEITQQSFADYLQASVLNPLEMVLSSYDPNQDLLASSAQGHAFHREALPNYRFTAEAAAGLHTTAQDLGRFILANMQQNPVLDSDTVTLMHHGVADVGDDQIGLGFWTSSDDKRSGHGGSNIGWRADIRFIPASGDGLVVLTNAESGSRLISDTVCYWAVALDIVQMTDDCAKRQSSLKAQAATLSTITVVLLILLVLVVGILFRGVYYTGRYTLLLSRPLHWRSLLLLLGTLTSTGWFLFAHTTLGVYLIAGIPYSKAIDHAADGFASVSWSALSLMVALSCLSQMQKRSSITTS